MSRRKKVPTEDVAVVEEKLPAPGIWPEVVPVLTALHISRGSDREYAKTLLGWLDDTFKCRSQYNPCHDKAYAALLHVVTAVRPRTSVWEYTDDPNVPLADIARAWNQAMCRLGYEIPL